MDGVTGGEEDEDAEKRSSEEEEEEERHGQLQLSVPDLINKDPHSDPRVRPCDARLASTPRSGKAPCRISLGEEIPLGNGAPCSKGSAVSADDAEPHPDLLSFE